MYTLLGVLVLLLWYIWPTEEAFNGESVYRFYVNKILCLL